MYQALHPHRFDRQLLDHTVHEPTNDLPGAQPDVPTWKNNMVSVLTANTALHMSYGTDNAGPPENPCCNIPLAKSGR